MLWTMAVILLGLWVLGMVSGAQLGMWVHLFFAFGLVAALLALLSSGRAVAPRGGAGRGAAGGLGGGAP
jgi:hypothetical protein